jgi:hypothetical protein
VVASQIIIIIIVNSRRPLLSNVSPHSPSPSITTETNPRLLEISKFRLFRRWFLVSSFMSCNSLCNYRGNMLVAVSFGSFLPQLIAMMAMVRQIQSNPKSKNYTLPWSSLSHTHAQHVQHIMYSTHLLNLPASPLHSFVPSALQ